MFEREIKFIYDFNVNQVKKLGTSFTFNSLATVSIHPAILKYISAEIDYLIYEDRKKLVENSNFDYTGENINKYFSFINDEIRKEKRLSIEYINQLIIHATSFTVNFLAQPKWALTKLIFAKENSLTVNEVKQILNYLYYYSHLRELLNKFITKKKLVTIDKSEFENLVDKIYRQLFSEYSAKIMDSVFDAMADFFNVGGINKAKIPYQALELFLEEKKLETYLERLKASVSVDIKQNYNVVELKKIIYSPIPVQKENYLDRIVKQEEPQILFSKNKIHEEVQPAEESILSEEIPPLESVIPDNDVVNKIIEAEVGTTPESDEKEEKLAELENPELQSETEIVGSEITEIEINEVQINEMMEELKEVEKEFSEKDEQQIIMEEEKLVDELKTAQEVKLFSPSEENEEKAEQKEDDIKSLQEIEIVKELFNESELKAEETIHEESVVGENIEEELPGQDSEIIEVKKEDKFFEDNIEWETETEEIKQEEPTEAAVEYIFEEEQKDKPENLDVPPEVAEDLDKEIAAPVENNELEEIEEKIENEVTEGKTDEKEIEESSFAPYFNNEDLIIVQDEAIEKINDLKEENKKAEQDEKILAEEKTEGEKQNEFPVIESEEFDLETVFDEKDLLIFEDDSSEGLIENTETEVQPEPEAEISEGYKPGEESFDERALSLMEDDNVQDKYENEPGMNQSSEEGKNKVEFIDEAHQSDELLPSDESKVLEEINDEIRNLSDDSVEEFNIEDFEKIEVAENETEKPGEELPEFNEELSLTEEKKAEEIKEKEKIPVKFERDISFFFKGKNIDKIISNIFDDDSEDFAQTFEKLSECSNIDEALAILDALFKSNRVKPSSKEAVLITNIVNEYFNQR